MGSALAEQPIALALPSQPPDRALVYWDMRRDAWMLRVTWYEEGRITRQETDQLAAQAASDCAPGVLWTVVKDDERLRDALYERIPDLPGEGYEWAFASCTQALHDRFIYNGEEAFRAFYGDVKLHSTGLWGRCPRCTSHRIFDGGNLDGDDQ